MVGLGWERALMLRSALGRQQLFAEPTNCALGFVVSWMARFDAAFTTFCGTLEQRSCGFALQLRGVGYRKCLAKRTCRDPYLIRDHHADNEFNQKSKRNEINGRELWQTVPKVTFYLRTYAKHFAHLINDSGLYRYCKNNGPNVIWPTSIGLRDQNRWQISRLVILWIMWRDFWSH